MDELDEQNQYKDANCLQRVQALSSTCDNYYSGTLFDLDRHNAKHISQDWSCGDRELSAQHTHRMISTPMLRIFRDDTPSR